MPPKKKTKEPVQTKLMFKPISATKSPATLFTMESSGPLRPHMSILNNNTSNNNRTGGDSSFLSKSETTASSSSSSAGLHKHNTVDSATTRPAAIGNGTSPTKATLHQIGGNGVVQSKGATSRPPTTESHGAFSTRDLVSSIPAWADSTGDGTDGYQDSRHNSTTVNTTERTATLKRQAESDVYFGSKTSPVALDSDSDDDSKSRKSTSTTTSTSTSTTIPTTAATSRQASTGSFSLLDQMATPRGTQPVPRSSGPEYGYDGAVKRAKVAEGKSSARPILISNHSTVSDDGFMSASSLDSRMQGRIGSREPELTPPLSQPSSQSRPEKYTPVQPKFQSYSQKRREDFSSFSKGGSGIGAGVSGFAGGAGASGFTTGTGMKAMANAKSRQLPPTVSRHSPASATPPAAFSGNSSFAKGQEWEKARSRSSSPAPAASTGVRAVYNSNPVAIGSGDRTKDGMLLSEEQQHVLEQVVIYHRNVFFTGSAGTGKSVLLRELIHRLRIKYRDSKGYWETTNDAVAVTASTGIAACNIGGCTLHSFVGAGLGTDALPLLIARVRKNSNSVRRWQDTKVLIIDEVSMIDADFMDKAEAIARAVRKNEQPWGGIQVVLTGDFFQLPPVNKNGSVRFCFEGSSWASSITSTLQLQQVFRQKDQTFADMLNEMRLGQMSPATIEKFGKLTRPLPAHDGLRATELFPLRNQVEEANNRMLQSLPGNMMVYKARDSGPMKDKMEQNCLAPTNLQLKINAQVMLLRNQSGAGGGGLVNGSLGILIGFVNRPADNDNPMGSDGQRKGSLNTAGEELPMVRFQVEGGQYREMVVGREEWKIELPNGDIQGSRIQIPLGLAWSLSIHKSQGQTLPKVKVDLGKCFEKGQAYVAMSRATSLEGLQVLNFNAQRVMVHPKVTEFYSRLKVYKTFKKKQMP